MNFQVTVLKILVSYPGGFAVMDDLKRDMAILATSGRDWVERTKRLASRVPDLDIFSQALVERLNGGWRITEKGRAVLEMEGHRTEGPGAATEEAQHELAKPAVGLVLHAVVRTSRRERRQRQRAARERAMASATKQQVEG